MSKTNSKMHMHDMVRIDTIVFEVVGGGGFKSPPLGSDKVTVEIYTNTISVAKV